MSACAFVSLHVTALDRRLQCAAVKPAAKMIARQQSEAAVVAGGTGIGQQTFAPALDFTSRLPGR